jgi:phage-related protein
LGDDKIESLQWKSVNNTMHIPDGSGWNEMAPGSGFHPQAKVSTLVQQMSALVQHMQQGQGRQVRGTVRKLSNL